MIFWLSASKVNRRSRRLLLRGAVARWSVKDGEETKSPTGVGPADCAALSSDGKTIASVRRAVVAHSPAQTAPNARGDQPKEARSAPAAGERGGSAIVTRYDLATGRNLGEIKLDEPETAKSIAYSPDNSKLAVVGSDAGITVWDTVSGQTFPRIRRVSQGVESIALSQDGTTLVAAGPGNVVTLWDVTTGKLRGSLEGHQGPVNALAFAPDGKTLATSGADWTTRLWDVRSRSHIASLATHNGPVTVLSFSSDGRTLATGGDDGRVLLWDASSGQVRGSLPTANDDLKPTALVFSPDGKVLATGANVGAVELWDVVTCGHLKSYHCQEPVQALVYSPSGETLYAAGSLGGLHAWSIGSSAPAPGASWPHTNIRAALHVPVGSGARNRVLGREDPAMGYFRARDAADGSRT